MNTTQVAWLSDQYGWGRMRTMTSLTPSAQTIHGPLQGLASFLAVPGFTEGVSSQTLAPGRYCLMVLMVLPPLAYNGLGHVPPGVCLGGVDPLP